MDDPIRILEQVRPVLEQWNLDPQSIELASHSENIVYKVCSDESQLYALRVHRPGYHTLASLNSEQSWTGALHRHGIKVPVAYQTRTGTFYAGVECDGLVRQVGLVRWIDGTLLDEFLDGKDQCLRTEILFEKMIEIGHICAQMHNQASAWQPPETFVRHHLDVDGFVGESPFWGRFWEVPELTKTDRLIITNARQKIYRTLSDYGRDPATYSMIHADLHTHNIMVSDDELVVIDFDDAGFGWHQYDLAVALYDYRERDDFESLKNTMISAYREQRSISDDDLSLLPLFMLIRALALIGWASARPELHGGRLPRQLIKTACQLASAN